MTTREVEGVALDLTGLQIRPGLINAHDHLHFAIFPRLGRGPYSNATAWARDIYHPDEEPLLSLLRVPKQQRLMWGGLRNLLCGVTTVHHHDPYHPCFDEDFPVRVVKTGWAHSLEFTPDVRAQFDSTPSGSVFVIHLAEGTDAAAEEEIYRLHDLGALDQRTVLVHAVGLSKEGWNMVERAGASVIWCPRSNMFTLGCTLDPRSIPAGVEFALGSDSPLTAPGDLLDEIAYAGDLSLACRLTGECAARVLRLQSSRGDWIAVPSLGEAPRLVVRDERILLIDPHLAAALPEHIRSEFFPLCVEGRAPVLVRWNTRQLFSETAAALQQTEIRLGGRRVRVQ